MFGLLLEHVFFVKCFLCLTYLDKNNLDCSSLSIYVSNLENLSDISEDEQQALDIFIDQLYEEMDRGTWRVYITQQ